MVTSGRIYRLLWLPLLQHGASWRMFSQAVSAKWNKSKIRKVDAVIGDVSSWYWKGGTATAQQFILEFVDHCGNHNSVEWLDRSSSSSYFSFSSSSSNSSLSSSRKLTLNMSKISLVSATFLYGTLNNRLLTVYARSSPNITQLSASLNDRRQKNTWAKLYTLYKNSW